MNAKTRVPQTKAKARVVWTRAKVFNKKFRIFDLPPHLRKRIYDYLYDEKTFGGTRDDRRHYISKNEYDARTSLDSPHRLSVTDDLRYDPITFNLPNAVPTLARGATYLDINLLAARDDPFQNAKRKRSSYNTSMPRRCGGRDSVCREMCYHTHYVRGMLSQLSQVQEVRIALHVPSLERLLHIVHSGDYFNGMSKVAKVEMWCIGLPKRWSRGRKPEDCQKRVVAT